MANSTPATQHMIRVVAEKFEVKGWKPGQMCCAWCPISAHWWNQSGSDATMAWMGPLEHHPVEIPPPDLLRPDGAWALLVALAQRHLIVRVGGCEVCLIDYGRDETVVVEKPIIDGNVPLALLTAAFQLTEEGKS